VRLQGMHKLSRMLALALVISLLMPIWPAAAQAQTPAGQGAAVERAALLARAHLAGRLGIPLGDIRTVAIDARTWPDSCLGLSSPGVMCAQVVTPGFRVLLEAGDVIYEYRTNEADLVLPAGSPTLGPTAAPTATPTPTQRPAVTPTPTPAPAGGRTAQWRGEYFANMHLSGTPALVRYDPEIRFDWGAGSPHPTLPADRFSVRWTTEVYLDAGTYTFYVATDDGARLWVNGVLVIDAWRDQSATTYQATRTLAAGTHSFRLEYYENTGDAKVRFWGEVGAGVAPTTTPVAGAGWRGEYFANMYLSGAPALVRYDNVINFNWGTGAPASGLPADRFSVRWTNQVRFDAGTYTFYATADDGVRLWVNDVLIIDQWRDGGARTHAATRTLGAGTHALRLEYYENTGEALVQLRWERGTPATEVPTGAWRGEYFGNAALSGSPALVRNDSDIRFDWGYNAPAPGLPQDRFSARWSRRVYFDEGQYDFTVRADDGVRLWIDGNLVLDRWHGGYTEDVVRRHLSAGYHDLRVDFFELEGVAKITVFWTSVAAPTPTRTRTPTPVPPPSDTWRAEFYRGTTLSGQPVLTRADAAIDFAWVEGVPVSGLSKRDGYSVRWTRVVYLEEGPYRFVADVQGGVRMWVGGKRIMDDWRREASGAQVGHLYLDRSGPYELRVEYRDGQSASIRVRWERMTTFQYWKGEYFANRNLSGKPVFVRDDPQISFDWRNGSPGPNMPSDNFSVRWTRTVSMAGGTYEFSTAADDGARLYVNGQLLIDAWQTSPGKRNAATLYVVDPGQHTIVVEYFEKEGEAKIAVGWQPISREGPKEVAVSG